MRLPTLSTPLHPEKAFEPIGMIPNERPNPTLFFFFTIFWLTFKTDAFLTFEIGLALSFLQLGCWELTVSTLASVLNQL